MPGQEGIPAVYSPMTRTLDDLEMFWKAVVSMKPWEYDHSVGPFYLLGAVEYSCIDVICSVFPSLGERSIWSLGSLFAGQ